MSDIRIIINYDPYFRPCPYQWRVFYQDDKVGSGLCFTRRGAVWKANRAARKATEPKKQQRVLYDGEYPPKVTLRDLQD